MTVMDPLLLDWLWDEAYRLAMQGYFADADARVIADAARTAAEEAAVKIRRRQVAHFEEMLLTDWSEEGWERLPPAEEAP